VRFALGLVLCIAACVAIAAPPSVPYPARVVRVIDADTLDLDVAVWPDITVRTRVRLAGVNAPESGGAGVTACELAAGRRAKAYTEQWVRLSRTDSLAVTITGTDKYGRTLGRIVAGNRDLAEQLVGTGHARRYAGGRRAPWCDAKGQP